jgi:uncharacterized membrane protein YphA (DoxX/SURF4 family)
MSTDPAAGDLERERLWGGLAAAARLLLAATLILSGVEKSLAPIEEFASVVESYRLLPERLHLLFAGMLPFAELLLGFALLSGWCIRLSAAGAFSLSLTFFCALASTLARRIQLDSCGCFGSIHLTQAQAMCVDSALMALAAVVFFKSRPGRWTLDAWCDQAPRA